MDPSSISNFGDVITEHIHLNWKIDFSRKIISGSATLTVKVLKEGLNELVLDSCNLLINKIVDGDNNELDFQISFWKTFGDKLSVNLKNNNKIEIFYETSSKSSAIQWLLPIQTFGKKYPYLFTQGQPIQIRSLLPCQDTPAIKVTYSADVSVESPFVALMSALRKGESKQGDVTIFHFDQPVPIPTYLIALAVGDVKGESVGARCTIWSEAGMLSSAVYEFAETENFLLQAEKMLVPYVWGRYDVLVLPPSFPYGGMENPCLTFVTPTLLAGDRSLVSVVIHEIMHSWTGNLVTSQSWEHFWLNEGFTVFCERKLIGLLYGEAAKDMDSQIHYQSFKEDVDRFGNVHNFTKLVPNLENINPDDAFSSVPYEKGFLFLSYLEEIVGKERFGLFLKSYIDFFKFRSISSDDFKKFFTDAFPSESSKIQWDEWFFAPGLPTFSPKYNLELILDCEAAAKEWACGNPSKAIIEMVKTQFSASQKVLFLQKLLNVQIDEKLIYKIDNEYEFCKSKNSEIIFNWILLCLANDAEFIIPTVASFLGSQGRMKYVRPIFRSLKKFKNGNNLANEFYERFKDLYHPIASKMIEQDISNK